MPALRLSLFYAAVFLLAGVQLPFWPVWLSARGLSAVEIGTLMAVGQWIKTATTPAIGMLADRSGDRRRIMVLLGAGTVVGFLLCLPAEHFTSLLLLNALTGACLSALIPLGDNAALTAASDGRGDYGRMRLWGTVAFIVATLLGGAALSGRDAAVILHLLIAASGLVLATCAALPPAASRRRASLHLVRGYLLAPRFVGFVAAATLIQASHSVYYAFGTLHWQALGYSSGAIAALWAEGAVAEVALFFWGGPLARRFGAAGLLVLGGSGGAVRWTVTALTDAMPVLALVQLLHALSFAATHLGAMQFLARHMPAEHSATGQTFYSAVVGGLGSGLGSLAAGALYAGVGGSAYLAMTASAAAGAGMAALLVRRRSD